MPVNSVSILSISPLKSSSFTYVARGLICSIPLCQNVYGNLHFKFLFECVNVGTQLLCNTYTLVACEQPVGSSD